MKAISLDYRTLIILLASKSVENLQHPIKNPWMVVWRRPKKLWACQVARLRLSVHNSIHWRHWTWGDVFGKGQRPTHAPQMWDGLFTLNLHWNWPKPIDILAMELVDQFWIVTTSRTWAVAYSTASATVAAWVPWAVPVGRPPWRRRRRRWRRIRPLRRCTKITRSQGNFVECWPMWENMLVG